MSNASLKNINLYDVMKEVIENNYAVFYISELEGIKLIRSEFLKQMYNNGYFDIGWMSVYLNADQYYKHMSSILEHPFPHYAFSSFQRTNIDKSRTPSVSFAERLYISRNAYKTDIKTLSAQDFFPKFYQNQYANKK
jgi:hypothetical protein